MPSSQKTDFLKLNKWSGADKPKRTDWNYDNDKIDECTKGLKAMITAHTAAGGVHVSQGEKDKWNTSKNFSVTTYVGTGAVTKTIPIATGVSFGVLFAVGKPVIANSPYHKSYSGYITPQGCSDGITYAPNGFSVLQQNIQGPSSYAVCLNETGVSYVCIYWS